MLFRFGILGLIAVLISAGLPLQAQESDPQESNPTASLPPFPNNCEPLPLVGGQGSEVTKEVSPPSLNIPLPGPASVGTRNNWHTDWFISNGGAYRSYIDRKSVV